MFCLPTDIIVRQNLAILLCIDFLIIIHRIAFESNHHHRCFQEKTSLFLMLWSLEYTCLLYSCLSFFFLFFVLVGISFVCFRFMHLSVLFRTGIDVPLSSLSRKKEEDHMPLYLR